MATAALLVAGVLAVPAALRGGSPDDGGRSRAAAPQTDQTDRADRADRAEAGYGRIPVWFEANRGQADPQADFVARSGGQRVLLTGDGPVFAVPERGDGGSGPSERALRFDLVGAASARAEALDPLPGRSNYLLGADRADWRTGVPHFGRVAYRGVWPGVDLVYRGDGPQLEYDFVLAPGADPDTVAVAVEGAEDLRIDGDGSLVARAGTAELRQSKPVVYQEVDGRRRTVDGAFTLLGGGRFGFRVGDHDRALPLVIDPVLTYSTYLGGSAADSVTAVAVDGAGSAYVTGSTSSTNFPVANALQPARNGASADVFVAKLNPSGTALVWSTYLGGTGADSGAGIAVDGSGNVVIAGATTSTNFPVLNAYQAAKGTGTTNDAFVTRLDAAGSAVTYSTYLGGGGADSATGVALDAAGTAYVAGSTASSGATPFPTVNPFQAATAGGTDAFVSHVDPAQSGAPSLVYSTHLGGAGEDSGNAVAVDAAGSAYLTGATRSANFPTTPGALKTSISGACPTTSDPARLCREAYVTKLAPAGNAAVYSTYLGGTTSTYHLEIGEEGTGIDVDAAGAAYVVGETSSDDFPTVGAVQGARAGDVDAFATKLNAAGSAVVYSTYLGGFGTDTAAGVAVDASGSAHVVGSGSATFPRALPLGAANGNGDASVTQLSASGGAIVHSTHLGGFSGDTGRGIDVDGTGAAYVGGNSFSPSFPTRDAVQAGYGGSNDGFVAKISAGPASGPLVTGVSPRSGPSTGGTPVVITGTGFTGVTGVNIGGVAVPSFTVESSTRIVAVTPGGVGSTRVAVTGPGGTSPANPVAEFTYAEGLWSTTGPQTQNRLSGPTLTLMANGKVLLAGGRTQNNGPALATAEIYDPLTNTWTATGSMITPRFSHTATLLADGRVLVAGGFNLATPVFNATGGLTNAGPVTNTAEVYNPATGTWSSVGTLGTRRAIHNASRLRDGRVLVSGGRSCDVAPPSSCDATRFTNTAELFNPATNTWAPTGAMAYGRYTTESVLLDDGRVLTTGGFGFQGDWVATAKPTAQQLNLDVTEIYDPATGAWTLADALNIGRARQSLVRLASGKVMAIGGFPAGANTSIEIYDPATNNWTPGANLPLGRAGQCSVLLPTGDVLSHLPGSYPTDLYDPDTDSWRPAGLTTVGHSCSTGVSRSDVVVLSSSPDRFEANAAVCGRNCGKALIVGDSDQAFGDLYTHAPVITGIQAVDSPSGTVAITITGLGFTDASAVHVAGRPSLEFKVESYDRITAVLPQGALGLSEVTVTTPGGRSQPLSVAVTQIKGAGYWLAASDGGVFAFGDAPFHGSTGNIRLNQPVVGMADTPSGLGYWLVASDGGVFAFGDAQFHGSTGAIRLNQPMVGMAPTPSGKGYWLVASDGGIFAFGDAQFYGSTGSIRLNRPMVAMAPTSSGNGYRLVASDGGVFAFGDAQFLGSTGGIRLNSPIVGTAGTPSGKGYWLTGADGGVFAFGDAEYFGSTGNIRLNRPVVGIASRFTRIGG